MWKQKIGISLSGRYGAANAPELIPVLKRIGFDAISPEWTSAEELEKTVSAAHECGMALQSLHAPFGKAAKMWLWDSADAAAALAEVMSAIDGCIRFKIPVLVVHTWIGFDYCFDGGKLYFGNFDSAVAYASSNGVKLAFENTEGEEYLFALMEHFKDNPNVGFCWDSGHEMCYNRSRDLLELFGDRLLMTHLNDNLGISDFNGRIYWTDDLHLLPYDGIADWENNVSRLKRSRPIEFLNFELNINSKPDRHENDVYAAMPLELYFTEAYKRACRIAYKYSVK